MFDVFFELEYENINKYSIVNFFINFVNIENYTSKDINKKENKYKLYNTSIYTENKNYIDKIYYSKNINYSKLIDDFILLKKKNYIIKKENVNNIQEALLNKNISYKINETNIFEKIKKDDDNKKVTKELQDIFMSKIFFKK